MNLLNLLFIFIGCVVFRYLDSLGLWFIAIGLYFQIKESK
jgi:hypothetical protein